MWTILWQNVNEDTLRLQLTQQLQSICDADPEVLTDYIVVLLKNEYRDESDVKETLLSQLEDFLTDHTISWVEQLLTYLKQNGLIKTELASEEKKPRVRTSEDKNIHDGMDEDKEKTIDERHDNNMNEEEEEEVGEERESDYGRRQMRREREVEKEGLNMRQVKISSTGREREWDRVGRQNRSRSRSPLHERSIDKRRDRRLSPRRGDRRQPEGMRQLERKQICRDFTLRRSCRRGNRCLYYHPEEDVNMSDRYDPENAALLPTPNEKNDGRGGHIERRGRKKLREENDRHHLARYDDNSTVLRIEKIPLENCRFNQLNDYFKYFGRILNIQIDSKEHTAVVQFATHAEALAAYQSPEAIFGNRFIKIFWARDQPIALKPEEIESILQQRSKDLVAVKNPANYKLDMTKETRMNALKTLLDIQKQNEHRVQKLIEEQKQLLSSLTTVDIPENDRKAILTHVETISGHITRVKNEMVQQLQDFQSQKRNRKNKRNDPIDQVTSIMTPSPVLITNSTEANMVDLNPDQQRLELEERMRIMQQRVEQLRANTSIQENIGVTPGRGRGYGRGHGRGATYSSQSRSFRLDMRPSKLIVTSLPPDFKGNLERISKHFNNFGELENIQLSGDGSAVALHFKNRQDAEKAVSLGGKINEHSLQMRWMREGKIDEQPAEAVMAREFAERTTSHAVEEAIQEVGEREASGQLGALVPDEYVADYDEVDYDEAMLS